MEHTLGYPNIKLDCFGHTRVGTRVRPGYLPTKGVLVVYTLVNTKPSCLGHTRIITRVSREYVN